jgi:LPXTG-motif cell wall-anchored protein
MNKKLIIGIVAGVAILGGAGIFLYIRKKKKDEMQSDNEEPAKEALPEKTNAGKPTVGKAQMAAKLNVAVQKQRATQGSTATSNTSRLTTSTGTISKNTNKLRVT